MPTRRPCKTNGLRKRRMIAAKSQVSSSRATAETLHPLSVTKASNLTIYKNGEMEPCNQQHNLSTKGSRGRMSEAAVESRQLMRDWLFDQVELGEVPGLQWLNKDKSVVKVPWVHASRQGWTETNDACLFRRWAVHTGRLEVESNAKRWKANFRCAMNSLPDVEQLRNECQTKGSQAFRIYRFLAPKVRQLRGKDKVGRRKEQTKSESSSNRGDRGRSEEEHELEAATQSILPTTVFTLPYQYSESEGYASSTNSDDCSSQTPRDDSGLSSSDSPMPQNWMEDSVSIAADHSYAAMPEISPAYVPLTVAQFEPIQGETNTSDPLDTVYDVVGVSTIDPFIQFSSNCHMEALLSIDTDMIDISAISAISEGNDLVSIEGVNW